jgi:hypothetical protein
VGSRHRGAVKGRCGVPLPILQILLQRNPGTFSSLRLKNAWGTWLMEDFPLKKDPADAFNSYFFS